MSYHVKEMFYSLQGEGAQAGRAAVFCRFSGCNLWSGREKDRATALCTFCDTDFVGTDGLGGARFDDAAALAEVVASFWPRSGATAAPLVICTGGEPLLQLDKPLVDALHARGFELAVETNGTLEPPAGIDWLTVSPKGRSRLVVRGGDELKLVYPQVQVDPADFTELNFRYFFLQPLDSPEVAANTQAALEYCLTDPRWRLSLQTHKFLGIR